MTGRTFWFEDHMQGERYQCASHVVTTQEIIEFAQAWDPQPWHIDEAAAAESVFGGLTACSAHIFSVYCITSQQWLNGYRQQVVASLGFDEMRMLKPVYAGDTLQCWTTIDSVLASGSRPDCGIVVYASELINQHDDRVFTVNCATLVSRRPATI